MLQNLRDVLTKLLGRLEERLVELGELFLRLLLQKPNNSSIVLKQGFFETMQSISPIENTTSIAPALSLFLETFECSCHFMTVLCYVFHVKRGAKSPQGLGVWGMYAPKSTPAKPAFPPCLPSW